MGKVLEVPPRMMDDRLKFRDRKEEGVLDKGGIQIRSGQRTGLVGCRARKTRGRPTKARVRTDTVEREILGFVWLAMKIHAMGFGIKRMSWTGRGQPGFRLRDGGNSMIHGWRPMSTRQRDDHMTVASISEPRRG